jgi:hypothetical protein
MNETLLALLSFGLGIATTVITQLVSRHFLFSDAERRRKLDNLQRIRRWMQAYRALFECEYPDILMELQPQSIVLDGTTTKRVYQALQKFREAKARYEEAEIQGKEALLALAENEWLDKLVYPIHRLYIALGGPRPRFSLSSYLSNDMALSYWYSKYPRGFPRRIAPYLEMLSEMQLHVFLAPEGTSFWVNWSKLDFIEPDDVGSAVRVAADAEAWGMIDNSKHYRHNFEIPIESVIREVVREEKKWFVPKGAG